MGFGVLVGIHQHWEVVNWEKSFLQANVIVQGMGIFFLVMPLAQTWHAKHQHKELTYEIL